MTILDMDDRFGVLAVPAEDKFGDEAVEVVLELGGLVGAVDDPAVILGIDVGLGTQLKSEILDDV